MTPTLADRIYGAITSIIRPANINREQVIAVGNGLRQDLCSTTELRREVIPATRLELATPSSIDNQQLPALENYSQAKIDLDVYALYR